VIVEVVHGKLNKLHGAFSFLSNKNEEYIHVMNHLDKNLIKILIALEINIFAHQNFSNRNMKLENKRCVLFVLFFHLC